ncbi:MAG TPA: sigma-70 family RNA polymerase sigma factor, partial [Polyangium sp.]|nr:sigma-70 family RNA polymerase sigma factor [Polyangium sp.]
MSMPASCPSPPTVRPDELLPQLLALRPDILRWLRSWTRVDADREDICQEVLRVCTRRLDTFDPVRGELRTWVYLHTARVAVRLVRRLRLQAGAFSPDEGASDLIPSSDPSPESAAIGTDDYQRLLAVLDGMDEGQLAVLLLHDQEELTHKEIAEELGIPVGTSKSRLHLARAEARRRLDGRRHEFRSALPIFFAAGSFARQSASAARSETTWRMLASAGVGAVLGAAAVAAAMLALPPRTLLHASKSTHPIELQFQFSTCEPAPDPTPAPTTAL